VLKRFYIPDEVQGMYTVTKYIENNTRKNTLIKIFLVSLKLTLLEFTLMFLDELPVQFNLTRIPGLFNQVFMV
jgi:hypothetical protein